ncbi:MAG: hypothetical protein FWC33_06100 [Candidatus Bathyarchaeota archaeon]|nr:hypothetical protein [Candidatus Termiticorpusculum sp.]
MSYSTVATNTKALKQSLEQVQLNLEGVTNQITELNSNLEDVKGNIEQVIQNTEDLTNSLPSLSDPKQSTFLNTLLDLRLAGYHAVPDVDGSKNLTAIILSPTMQSIDHIHDFAFGYLDKNGVFVPIYQVLPTPPITKESDLLQRYTVVTIPLFLKAGTYTGLGVLNSVNAINVELHVTCVFGGGA